MKRLLSFEGGIGRVAYVCSSAGIFFIQHLVAWHILAGQRSPFVPEWWFWFDPLRAVVFAGHGPSESPLGAFGVTLAVDIGLVALAFIRARQTRRGEGLAALAFVPYVQILVVGWFTLAPEQRDTPQSAGAIKPADARTIAEGLLLGAAMTVAAVAFSTLILGLYGDGLFVLSPFIIGLTTAYLANRETDLGARPTLWLAVGALSLGAVGLIGFAFEGIICLLLAAPLVVPLGLIGAIMGRTLARGKRGGRATVASVAITPLLLMAEMLSPPKAGFDSVETIDISAPPEAVWDAVIHMGPIPDPPALPFRWGLAYPMRGEFLGEGVGAIRLGVFSTGIAYEQVTEWRPNQALSFIVLSDPPTMNELSPYTHVNAPHVSGYFHTSEVHFTLTPLADGETRLSLATRHECDLEPALYWIPLAEWATRVNKRRVLEHFRRQAEASGASTLGYRQ
jgi:hypothetical protein